MAKQKLFHIVKRDHLGFGYKLLVYVGAVLLALAVGAVLLAILGVDPIKYYSSMITIGLPKSKFPESNIESLIKIFVPLLMTSTALALAFKMKFWNIGGEGQFIAGTIAAGFVALKFGPEMDFGLCLVLMMLSAMLCAGLLGVFVAFLKVKFNTNETLLTLMLNYVVLYVLKFFAETKADWNLFLSTTSQRPMFANLNMKMPTIQLGRFHLDISLIIAVVITVLIFIYMKYTKQGYEINVVGDSSATASYAGMKVGRIIIRTTFISAAIIGLAGACSVSTANIMSTSITNDVGWTGIIVAWLAKLNIWGVTVVSLLISVLQYGCQFAGSSFSQVDAHFADILQGIILFFVLAADFLVRFKIMFHKKGGND